MDGKKTHNIYSNWNLILSLLKPPPQDPVTEYFVLRKFYRNKSYIP